MTNLVLTDFVDFYYLGRLYHPTKDDLKMLSENKVDTFLKKFDVSKENVREEIREGFFNEDGSLKLSEENVYRWIAVQECTSEIKSLMHRTVRENIEIGQKLIDVKQKLSHGQFGDWIAAEFDWGKTTAWKFMTLAKNGMLP